MRFFTDDFRLSYVSSRSNVDLPGFYKFAALWGGQEGSLLFWSWILATYSFIAVYLGRRAHRDMISYVVAIMMSVQAFFLMLIAFVVSPFQVLMSGVADYSHGRRQRPESVAATSVDGHPSSDVVSRLRRVRRAVRLRDGVADHPPARRSLDSHDARLDDGHMALPGLRHSAGCALVIRRARLGRLLGMGTRSRMLRSCRGSPLRPSFTR